MTRLPLRLLLSASIPITLIGLVTLPPLTAHAQTAHLTFRSEPGDFIGGGQTFDYTYAPSNSGIFDAAVIPVLGQPQLVSELTFAFSNTGIGFNRNAILMFSTTQLNTPMAVGTYLDAERAPFASAGHPGLDVSFRNRGSNTLIGNFTVTDFAYTDTGSRFVIDRFAASFEQKSDNSTGSLFGTFTYNATGTLAPEPGSLALLLPAFGMAGILSMVIRKRRKK